MLSSKIVDLLITNFFIYSKFSLGFTFYFASSSFDFGDKISEFSPCVFE